jgi:LCP family protein required for cell wall assembly
MSSGSSTPYGRATVPVPGQDRMMVGRASVPTSPPPGRIAPVSPPGGGRPALVGGGRRRRRWRKVLLWFVLSLLLLAGIGAGGGWLYLRSLDDNMERIDVFSQITAERPAPVTGGSNILMLGSDSRDPDATAASAEADSASASPGEYRADTIMLLHIPSSQQEAYLISLPRDLWVYIPPNADGSAGDVEAKLNAATAFGGPPLMVQTVEDYTGVRIDHVMLIDFAGFVEVTDALGGVDMNIEETIRSVHGNRRTFEEGNQHLNGEEALDYVRQRYQFQDGDFARMRHQQQFLRALMDKAASTGTLTNPVKLNAFLQTVTSTLTVDEDFSLSDTAWQFRHLRSDNLTFMTSPHAGTGTIDGQSVVLSDDEAATGLYTAIRDDRITEWIANNS